MSGEGASRPRSLACRAVFRADAQAAFAKRCDEFASGHVTCSRRLESIDDLFGDVVVIEIEAAWMQALLACELVQFFEVAVADQMRPQPPVCGPAWSIDENGHRLIIGTCNTRFDTRRELLRDSSYSGSLDPWCVSFRVC